MGLQERKKRERAQREEAILRAATDLAERDGWDAVTIRNVAAKIEYSAPTLYEHFESKQALLGAIVRRGFRALTEALTPHVDGAAQDFDALVNTYWRFSRDHAAVYDLMHGLAGVPFGAQGAPEEARETFAVMRRAVSAALPPGTPDMDDKVDTLWAVLHGLITLDRAGRMAGGPRRAQRLAEAAVATLLERWRARAG